MSEKKIITLMIILFILLIILGISYNIIDSKLNSNIENNTSSIDEELLIKEKINSISIKYYPEYNIASAEAINNVSNETFIDSIIIKLDGEDKNKFIEFLSKIKEVESNPDFDPMLNELEVIDYFQLIVNNNIIISMGYSSGMINNKKFNVTSDIASLSHNIIDNYNNGYLYKTISSTKFSCKTKDAKDYVSFDEKEIGSISDFKYFYVHEKEDFNTFDGGYKYVLRLDDMTLYLFDSHIAYMKKDSGEESYIIIVSRDKQLYHYISEISVTKKY